MSIKIFSKQICPLELITDEQTGKLSQSKIWMNVANAILSRAILIAPNLTWDLIASYGAVVGGSHVAITFLKWRYRDNSAAAPTEEKC